jgi:hypothetical protein
MNFSKSLLAIILNAWSSISFAQLTINNGTHSIEITGAISGYYNYRFLKPDEIELNKNRFRLRDAQIQLEGRIGKIWAYELQFDVADMVASGGVIDGENPGLMDAHVTYKGLPLDIQAGYGKTPYSRNSLTPFIYSPYWQRAQITRGEIFSRRDIGITLSKDFWRQRINLYGGAYMGLGEMSLRGDNDASGALENIVRADFAYPTRFRYREVDDRHVPIPMFQIGFNGRYTNRTLPEESTFPPFASGKYGLNVLNGERYVYGMDFAFMFKGFSVNFEIHQYRGQPTDSNSPFFQGYSKEEVNGFFLTGGAVTQLSYFIKPWRTILSGRYEQLDLNDLNPGRSDRLSIALAYQIDGFNSMIKMQFFHIMSEEPLEEMKWTEQIRIGWQLLFK